MKEQNHSPLSTFHSQLNEVPAGYKQTEVGVIPEDWEGTTLGEISEVRMCKRIFSEQTRKIGEIPFFKIGTFGSQPDAYIPSILFEEYKSKYSFPEKGDILISAAGTLGKSVIYDGVPAYFQDSNIVWLEIDKNKLLNNYLYQYYKVIKWASSEGSTIARLYNAIIRSSTIAIPPIQEQTAIANALSDVDTLIAALETLINKKSAIKTAAMQQLLTGKKRLSPFDQLNVDCKQTELGEIPGDWEVAKLGDICSYINDGTHHTPKYVSSGVPFYSVENVTANEFVNTKYITDSEHQSLIKRCKPEKGDILFTRIGVLAKTKLIDWDVNASIYVSLALLKPKNWIDPSYVYGYTKSNQFYLEVEKRSLVNATPQKINMAEIRDVPIVYPSNKEEQTSIANVLSDMDKDLEALQQRLHKTQQIKQGMMQELLTGRVRLINGELKMENGK